MPDEFDAYVAKVNSNKGGRGLVQNFTDLYDRFDQSWLPAEDFSKEQYAEENWGLPGRALGSINRGVRNVSHGVADALFGSPVRALGTAGTIVSGGATKLPSVVRGGIAALDAVDAARSGIRAKEAYEQGNYGTAAGNVLGAGMQGASTIVPVGRKVTKGIRSYAEPVVPPPVVKAPDVSPTITPNKSLNVDRLAMELKNTNQIAQRPVVRTAPEPTQLKLRIPRDFTDDAKARLTQLDIPIDEGIIAKYNRDAKFRTKVQELTGGVQPVTPKIDAQTELFKRGVTRPGEELLSKVEADPKLLDKFVPPTPKPEPEFSFPEQGTLFDAADDDFTKLDKMIASDKVNPETTAVIQKAKDNLAKSNWFSRTATSLDTSMERELEKMGPVGTEIARQVKIASTDKPIRFNSYIKDVRKDIEAADPKTWESIVDNLDQGTPLKDEKAINLAERVKKVLDQTGTDLNEAGLLEKGQRQTYWPHRYEKESTIKEALKAQGMDETQVAENLQRIRDFREQKISGEFSRNDLNVPGYRKDKDVLIDHLRDVSNRVEDATRFGAKDINDPTSQISKLISQSENPERARELMTRILRGDATSTETQKNIAGAIRKYATASQLSLASISNFGGTLPVAVRAATGDAISGVGRAFQKELPDMKFMENTNLFRKFSGGFAETLNDHDRMYKVFGIEGSQNWLNRYAGAVGNSYAQTLFEGLKKNPSDTKAIAQLEDLILDKGSEVLKQGALTDKQLERAMVRMAEVSQGVVENRKLPYFWNKEGLATIPQIFMRTSFQTSKALKDAVKMDPKRAIPKLIGGGLAIGEVIGDVKEGVKTGAQVGMNSLQQLTGDTTKDKNFVDEYKKNIGITKDDDTLDRFSFTRRYLSEIDPELAKNDMLVRGLGNLEQSFALGMPADILRSLTDALGESRGDPLNEAMKLFWAWDEGNTISRAGAKAVEGNYRDVGREVLKRVPFVGRGAAREVQTTAQEKRNTGTVKW